jgi:hypothetical protein
MGKSGQGRKLLKRTAEADVVVVEEPTEEVFIGSYGGTSKKKLVKQCCKVSTSFPGELYMLEL